MQLLFIAIHALQYTILCISPLCFAFLQYCILYVHVCTTLGLTRARSHANRVSEVDSTSLREAHPGVLSDSLTECVTQNANCAYLCSHLVPMSYLHFVSTPSELHFSSTNMPATTPVTSFLPHHSYELLPLPALATHPPHLHPPLLQLSALSSNPIIC